MSKRQLIALRRWQKNHAVAAMFTYLTIDLLAFADFWNKPRELNLLQVFRPAPQNKAYYHIVHDPFDRCVVVGENGCSFVAGS